VREEILGEELERDLRHADGWHLLAELDMTRVHVDRIDSEHASEAEQLSWWVVRISNVLVDLGVLPIRDISQLPKSAPEVLPAVDLILKRLEEGFGTHKTPISCANMSSKCMK
jgi:hypothetical protein